MSIHAPTVVSPLRPLEDTAWDIGEQARLEFEAQVVFELASRDDLAFLMAGVVAAIRRATRAERVEWWAPEDQEAPVLVAAALVAHELNFPQRIRELADPRSRAGGGY
jgi:hypothetical protein